ncbi:MAG: hypothetical protein JWR16_1146 [Nevskia sp.]|nr:hypothetical protein [Nevskia sp.]
MSAEQHYDYCVLRFSPSRIRGETVNVGLIVFLEDSLDIRLLKSAAKAKTLVAGLDNDLLPGAAAELKHWSSGLQSVEARYGAIKSLSYFNCSPLGRFTAASTSEYRQKIKQLFTEWVEPLSELTDPVERKDQLFFKLWKRFEDLKVLSSDENDLELGMVLPRYPIDLSSRIFGEYVFQCGGTWNVIETLDLDAPADRLKRNLAYKAFVLDYSRHYLSGNVRTYLIYRGGDFGATGTPIVQTVSRYADEIVNADSTAETFRFLSHVKTHATPNYSLLLQ